MIAVHSNNNVYIEIKNEDDKTEKTVQVTTNGTRWMRYGAVSWLYKEDKGEYEGMWWFPDSVRLVYYKFDERNVPRYPMIRNLTKPRSTIRDEGYPNPGDPLPIATLYIYDINKKTVVPVDCGQETNQYIYHVRFTPDGSKLLFSRLDRRQRNLEFIVADPETGKTRIIVTAHRDTWQLNDAFWQFLEDGKRFIWSIHKNDFNNYELRHIDGRKICVLTDGKYPVDKFMKINEATGWIYYSAYSETRHLNLQLHKVRLDGTGHQQLTPDNLNHSNFSVSPDSAYFIVQAETINIPASTYLYDSNGTCVATLAKGNIQPFKEAGMPLSEIFTFKADDGKTDLYGILHKPWNFNPSNTYPLLNHIYGGPGSKDVHNVFQLPHRATRRGYLVTKIDNRGTLGRGYAFMEAIYGEMGILDLKDQVDGTKILLKRPYVDPRRIGVYGTSHGGFMAASAILQYPDVFTVAVENAGITDWRYYTATYTERFQDLPAKNPEGYQLSSCLTHAKNLKGHFLIQHGMVDHNVHPNNVLALADALHRAEKNFEMQLYPNNGHWIGREGMRRQWEFLDKHLKPR
jgi:dipeptidyl-peptidase-4